MKCTFDKASCNLKMIIHGILCDRINKTTKK